MPSWLIDSLATTDALADVFSDASLVRGMLAFETALAAAEAMNGLIPRRAAELIATVAAKSAIDAAAVARDARESGTIAIPFVKALTDRVGEVDAESAQFVHWGATSQDVVDTAMVLALGQARAVLAADHERLVAALRVLSDRHARTVMLGRTLLQPAPPITFGLKAARWLAAAARGWNRANTAFTDAAALQFGGASGTLAALGPRSSEVARAVAYALQIENPPAPWHTDRDRLAALATALAVYTGTLGKIARDIALLMQDEVSEAAEPGGGSSTMPHKRNPASCAIAMAGATRMPGLAAAFLGAMTQEHERAAGGWQSEWPTLAAIVQGAGAVLRALAGALEHLEVFPDRMRDNIARTNGAIFAERVVMLALPRAGKAAARALVDAALERVRRDRVTLGAALASLPDARRLLTPDELRTIDVPEEYLGAAEEMRVALLESAT